jgi:hypothetical protein
MTDVFTMEDRAKLNEMYEFFQMLKQEREERDKFYQALEEGKFKKKAICDNALTGQA